MKRIKKIMLLQQQLEELLSDTDHDEIMNVFKKVENGEGDLDVLLEEMGDKKKLKGLIDIIDLYKQKKALLEKNPNDDDIKIEVDFWRSALIEEFGFGE